MDDGSAGAAPTSQRIEQTTIPSYAQPYVEEMLGAARANVFETDPSGNITGFQPYQTYGGERVAQFTPLQMQAYEGAGALEPAAQVAAASHMAQQAGLAGMQAASTPYAAGQFAADRVRGRSFVSPTGAAQYFAENPDVAQAYRQDAMNMTPEQFAQTHYERHGMFEGRGPYTSQSISQQYMSPYMQNVVDVQQREAQRQADIAAQQQQANAVRAGAFGGGRDAIMRSEAQRNLATQLGAIQAQGLQSAYQQAQSQFNADQARQMQAAQANQQASLEAQRLGEQSRQYGAGFGLSGIEAALRSAGTLGQLGQTQFGQETGSIQQQALLGQQQQQQVQNIMSQQYQDFLNQQRYPYQQLGFMSDMLRGLPMGQTATSLYQAPPSPVAQLAGAGTALAGLSGVMRAKGGPVHSSQAGLADLMASRI
jgi:hypothetical protein